MTTMIHCKFCGGEAVVFTAHDGVLTTTDDKDYLDGEGAQEQLAQVCIGHVYLSGLTPAVQHPASKEWVAGVIHRVGGRNEDGHPFYAWLRIPYGMSPAQAAELQFPGCYVGGMGDEESLSRSPITLKDLFPYGGNMLGTGILSK